MRRGEQVLSLSHVKFSHTGPRKPTKYSADRVLNTLPAFVHTSPDGDQPVYFVGEMVRRCARNCRLITDLHMKVFRDMFQDYAELSGLQEVADLLASKTDWPELYNEAQLGKNEVDVYAAIYVEDMYVHFDLARETASKIRKCKAFITNTSKWIGAIAFWHLGLTRCREH